MPEGRAARQAAFPSLASSRSAVTGRATCCSHLVHSPHSTVLVFSIICVGTQGSAQCCNTPAASGGCCLRAVSATPTAASPGSSSDWFASPTLQRPASSITQAGHAAPISPADSHASPGPAAAAASLRAPLSPALPDAPSSPADAPLPGTPAPPPQQQQQQGEEGEEAVPSPAATPVGMHTPGPAAAADVPAGGTPASVCYTPGQPALDSGLLSGFTPSPAPGAHGSLAMPSPTSSTGGFGAGGYSPQPAEAAGEAAPQPWQAPAAGGPQVSDAPKPAFAAYSAAAAAASAAAAAGGSSSS